MVPRRGIRRCPPRVVDSRGSIPEIPCRRSGSVIGACELAHTVTPASKADRTGHRLRGSPASASASAAVGRAFGAHHLVHQIGDRPTGAASRAVAAALAVRDGLLRPAADDLTRFVQRAPGA